MKIKLSFAELHTPMFYGSVNWGVKLFEKQAKGQLGLVYDRAEKELLIQFKDLPEHIIPTTNVVGMTPVSDSDAKLEMEKPKNEHPTIKRGRSAQASTPMSHVHAGEGSGKFND